MGKRRGSCFVNGVKALPGLARMPTLSGIALTVNGRLAAARDSAPAVSDYVDRAHVLDDYGQYLRLSRKIRML